MFTLFLIALLSSNALALDWFGDISLTADSIERAQTYRLIENQMRDQQAGSNNFQNSNSLQLGKARAQEMVSLIKDKELKARWLSLKPLGERIQRSELETPAKVIAVGVALWIGKDLKLVKTDQLKLETYIEGRARTGSLRLVSPMFNSDLAFRAGGGLSLAMNREIPLIASNAEIYFGMADQSFRTAISRAIAANLIFSIGTSSFSNRQEENARLSYSVLL